MTENHECESPYCKDHGIILERRQTDRKATDEIYKHIGTLLTAKNIFIGYSILATVFLLGSYKYTNDHDNYAKVKYAQYDAEIDGLKDKLSGLKSDFARTDERYISVTNQLKELNGRISQLIEIMVENKKDGGKKIL